MYRFFRILPLPLSPKFNPVIPDIHHPFGVSSSSSLWSGNFSELRRPEQLTSYFGNREYWHHSRTVSRLLRLTCELWKDFLQAGTRKQTTSPTALACYQGTGYQTRYPTSYEAQQHGLRDVSTRRATLISRLVYPYGYYVFDTLLYCACKQQAWPVHKTKTVLLSAYAQSRLPALS